MSARSGLLALLAVLLAACAGAPAPPPEDSASGRVSGELLLDPATPVAGPAVDEVHETPVQLAGNAPPEYPQDLVRLRLPPRSVAVRIFVDRAGKVARVDPLPAAESPQAGDEPFVAAVRAALQRWRFEPFRVIQWGPGPDHDGDGESDGEVVIGDETRPFRFDMRFRFEVVDGVARVSS